VPYKKALALAARTVCAARPGAGVICLEAGMNTQYLVSRAKIVGHSGPKTTRRVYDRACAKFRKKANDR
jgi:hypothetical protein